MPAEQGIFLGIETSGEYTALALVTGDSVLARSVEPTRAGHNERIFELLDELFRSASATPDRLSGVGVTIGPGMFTSLRVGLAVAKGISLSHRVPLKGVSTLDAIVHTVISADPGSAGNRCFLPLVDARKGELYCALYQGTTRRSEYLVLNPAELPGLTDAAVTLCGSDTLPGRAALEAAFGGRAVYVPVEHPGPEQVARLARFEILAGRADDAASLSPVYLRRTDAELHRAAILTPP
jgi:tRNA threonylcarbamoyladenosine biosynthesis protein TsaB